MMLEPIGHIPPIIYLTVFALFIVIPAEYAYHETAQSVMLIRL